MVRATARLFTGGGVGGLGWSSRNRDVGALRSFDHDFLRAEVTNLPGQLHLVVSQFAGVFEAQIIALKGGELNKGDRIAC